MNRAASGAVFDIESIVAEQLHLLKPVEDCWQPSDLLPDMHEDGWVETVKEFRRRALNIPDELLVVLIGNVITEEALPSYQASLNRVDGLQDETGAAFNPWAVWTRAWTAEENRHGDLLDRYLYLTGRVNMHSVELTTHHLIRNGFEIKSGNDLYRSLIYVAFQERATKISHGNVGRLAEKCGEPMLGKMCALIAADEARHEEAYKRIVARLVEIDPARAVTAFSDMMKQKIVMPARLMSDGTNADIFSQFAITAQRCGVYTTRDYADVIAHLVSYWNIAGLSLSGEEAAAQEHLCGLAARYLEKAAQIQEVINHQSREPFEWIYGRSA